MGKIFKAFFAVVIVLAVFAMCNQPAYAKGESVYEGVDYSPVYDYDYYITYNPDLVKPMGGDQTKTLLHFINYGMKEGRKSHPNFDWKIYRIANKDLKRAFGDDTKAYYIHYIVYGQHENRVTKGPYKISKPVTKINGVDFKEIYDFEFYYSMNTDVANAMGYDDEKVLKHFAEYGIYEKRLAKEGVFPDNKKYIELQEKYKPFVSREAKYPVAASLIRGGDLRRAFEISHSIPYFGHNDQIPSEPVWTTEQFADFGFTNKKGNCYVMAAMFYEMAYVLGYNPRQMAGWVPSRTRGRATHSWVEIDINGETFVFDPDFTYATKKNGFMFKYGTKGTWRYMDYSPM